MAKHKKKNPRIIALTIVLLLIIGVFSIRLVDFQVVNADKYASEGNNISRRTAPIKAARGEILDRYGRPIAINKEGYNITFNSAYMTKSTMNNSITKLTNLLKNNALEWIDVLPMTKNEPYEFTDNEDDVSRLKSKIGLNHYATAQNCFDEMVHKYKLEGIARETQRELMGVRYSMERSDFSIALPYTFAENVSSDIMKIVLENKDKLPGVEIQVVPFREYVDDTLAPHLMGAVGKIQAENWEKYKKKGYSYSDFVGTSGVEEAFEDYLHGQDGVVTYEIDNNGEILSSKITKQPVNGNTVMLSLDKRLQLSAQKALKAVVDEHNGREKMKTNITGASIVATEVKTGQVLVSANYPSYTMTQLKNDFETLKNDTVNKPLVDRAFNGIYPPGSVFKPAVALAGLQMKVISPTDTIRCTRRYTYFSDYQPSCMGYHGSMNVSSALSKSCNYFFFETGRRLGIENMNKFCRQLGLGEYSGVEVPESKGVLASPQYSASVGNIWNPGNTIQAAIGQSDNLFTPLQLATYTATIASNGTRYKASLLNEVKTYNMDKSIYVNNGVENNHIEVDQEFIKYVKDGMKSVAEEGTARQYFSNYPIKVGGKTGTAQTIGDDHSVFVVFAPFDNPEIAISVVVEHGKYSSTTGPVAKTVLDEFFFNAIDAYKEPKPN
ncbi:MAG: penicillin-binding transpeptidase domain-containing protein, partial [Oscillospiraceae bacterium]